MTNNFSKTESWKNILLFMVSYLFITGLFQYIGIHFLEIGLPNSITNRTIQQQVIISFIGMIGTLMTVYIFMRFLVKEPFFNIGLSIKCRIKDIGIGIAVGFLIIGIGYLSLLFLNQITFEKIEFNVEGLLLSLFLFVVVALGEEIVFRGYVLRNLMNSYGRKKALVISAIIFSLVHASNPHMNWITYVNLFLAGIVLGLPYVLTGNLWFSIALHFSWNFSQSFFGFNVSGQNTFSAISVNLVGNNILNGGDFGFEGSIFGIIAQLIIIVFINYQTDN